jgi:hypothetical protein
MANEITRKNNFDMKVNKAFDYFRGSDFKDFSVSNRSSTEFRNDDTEFSLENNKENVRLSTTMNEINKPVEKTFNNSSNI